MKCFGEKGDEVPLLGLLNAVLQKTGRDGLQSVEIVENKSLSAEVVGDKFSILDVRSVLPDGTKANIEVQLRNVDSNMSRRSLFYWSREYTKGIEAGQDYANLPNVIVINVIDFDFIPLGEVHTSFHLREDSHTYYQLTDALEIHFINMVRFRRLLERDVAHNRFHRWMAFLDKTTDERTIKEIIKMDRAIEQAYATMRHVAQDKDMYRAYQMREMALSDFTSSVNHARREGIAIGEQRGEQRGIAIGEQRGITIGEQRGEQRGIAIGEQQGDLKRSIIVVASLRAKGFSVEEIAEYTCLPMAEVTKILKGHGQA
jgi:predicted transposase/invertase (TIGR01784 family)